MSEEELPGKELRTLQRKADRLHQQAATAEELLDTTRRINWQVQDELEQRVRELEAAREAQARLMAVISHELRTPMNGMLGATQLLLDRASDPEDHELLVALQMSTRALARLADQVLSHNRGLYGQGSETAPVDLRALVHQVRVLHVNEASLRGLQLSVRISPRCPLWVRTDEGRLRQILTNLVDNALKYCRDGEVEVSLAWDERCTFAVRDTGPGIGEADQAAIFEPFQRGRRDAVGWGLGLAICRDAVALLGGELGLESRVGVGSTFSFSLELRACDGPTPERPRGRGLLGVRVLVVDDNEVNRLVARKMLETLGADVVEAVSGLNALERVREDMDVILLDLAMPGMDGYTCARALRSRGVESIILALSASSLPGTPATCIAAGMDGYIHKPVLREELHARIARALRDRSARAHPGPAD
jgi:two-component system, sensor histidine kinase